MVTALKAAGFAGSRVIAIKAYWVKATHDFRCEGTSPLARVPVFGEGHREISHGDRFLRKVWETPEGIEFYARHCVACAVAMGVRDGE